jgi:hypothetical protein
MGENLCGSLIISVSKEQLQESGEHWHLLSFIHTRDPNHSDYKLIGIPRVSDTYCIHLIRIRIQHFRLNTDSDPIRIQGFYNQKTGKKFTAEKKNYIFLDQKLQFTYP